MNASEWYYTVESDATFINILFEKFKIKRASLLVHIRMSSGLPVVKYLFGLNFFYFCNGFCCCLCWSYFTQYMYYVLYEYFQFPSSVWFIKWTKAFVFFNVYVTSNNFRWCVDFYVNFEVDKIYWNTSRELTSFFIFCYFYLHSTFSLQPEPKYKRKDVFGIVSIWMCK